MPTSQAAPNVTALNAVTALSNPNGLLIHLTPQFPMGSSQPTMSPSDVSSPLVVMATSSSITVTGGLCSPARGPQTTIFNVQAQQMTLRTVVTAASTVGGQGVGPPAAISTIAVGHSGYTVEPTFSYSHGPLYFFSLVAYKAGGSTQSNASSVTTIKSIPLGCLSPTSPSSMQQHSPLFGPLQSSVLQWCSGPPVTPTGTALQLERVVWHHQCCSQPAQTLQYIVIPTFQQEDSLLGGSTP
eukprot:Em0022g858a